MASNLEASCSWKKAKIGKMEEAMDMNTKYKVQ